MNCREIADFLNLYVEGELPTAERTIFEAHLAECPNCRAYIASYRTTVSVVQQSAARDDCSPPVPEDLVRAILASVTTPAT